MLNGGFSHQRERCKTTVRLMIMLEFKRIESNGDGFRQLVEGVLHNSPLCPSRIREGLDL
jgi:hypothetical protein